MKESEWFSLLQNPQGRLVRVFPKLFKHFSQFGSAGVWYPKGQIVLMVSLDGWERPPWGGVVMHLWDASASSKRLDANPIGERCRRQQQCSFHCYA